MILVDTSVFVAAADRDETRHRDCAQVLRDHHDLTVAAPVVAETAWMTETRLGPVAESRFLRLVTSDRIRIIDLAASDYTRAIDLIDTYADLGLGFVDASIIAISERFAVTSIATLNTRDFHVVRPAHTPSFELLPTS